MIVRHFDVKIPEAQPPQEGGWEQTWHGYYEMIKCESLERRAEYVERDRVIHAAGMMTEADFERDCFLSVLADIKRQHVNMFELGAGWGRMSLALAGVVNYRLIPLVPVSYRCLAVEGEPTHYRWIKEHFETQDINGIVVHGAVSNKSGTCRFNADPTPDSCYGQAMNPLISRRKIPSIMNLYNLIKRRTIKIPMYTVDQLIQMYGFDHVDIVDIDVQGAECEVVSGAAESIKNELINYMLIGTHLRELNDALRRLLSPEFDLIVDIYPDSVATVNGFAPIRCHDGIQLYKRKDV